ncbi:hypothetical protein DENSPDRAFT_895497 [Dentipellis sp. KUC8613]|nr:hypothetical protein DENSPDRAFT_895497 [Dentipellis sp. KUC8613]
MQFIALYTVHGRDLKMNAPAAPEAHIVYSDVLDSDCLLGTCCFGIAGLGKSLGLTSLQDALDRASVCSRFVSCLSRNCWARQKLEALCQQVVPCETVRGHQATSRSTISCGPSTDVCLSMPLIVVRDGHGGARGGRGRVDHHCWRHGTRACGPTRTFNAHRCVCGLKASSVLQTQAASNAVTGVNLIRDIPASCLQLPRAFGRLVPHSSHHSSRLVPQPPCPFSRLLQKLPACRPRCFGHTFVDGRPIQERAQRLCRRPFDPANDLCPPWSTMLTRAERFRRLEERLVAHETQPERTIDSPDVLRDLIWRCESNPFYSHGLQILLLEFPSGGVTLNAIRTFLLYASFIDTLKLLLFTASPTWWTPGTVFQNLTTLETTIDHKGLVGFLSAHVKIVSLALGRCGHESRCPLEGIALPALTELTCPPGCVRGLLNGNPVSRLIMTDYSPEDLQVSSSDVVRAGFLGSAARITRLQTFFNPTDKNFLRFLFEVAPYVRDLTIKENPWSHATTHSLPYWRRHINLFKDLVNLEIVVNGKVADNRHTEDRQLCTLLPTLPKLHHGGLLRSLRVQSRISEDSSYEREWKAGKSSWRKVVINDGSDTDS